MNHRRFMSELKFSLAAVVLLTFSTTLLAAGQKPVLVKNTGLALPSAWMPVPLTTAHLYVTDRDDGDNTIF